MHFDQRRHAFTGHPPPYLPGAPEMLGMAFGRRFARRAPHAAQICSIYMAADAIKAVMRQLVGRPPPPAKSCRFLPGLPALSGVKLVDFNRVLGNLEQGRRTP
jgi:hypothetical protein